MYQTTLYIITEIDYRQYMIECNLLEETDTLFTAWSADPQPPAAARIGHLHHNILEKLSLIAKRVQFSHTSIDYCEIYSLAKTHQIVS